MTSIPNPPAGHATWLDCAVAKVEAARDIKGRVISSAVVSDLARAELAALRAERDTFVNTINEQAKAWTKQVTALQAEHAELLAALEPFALAHGLVDHSREGVPHIRAFQRAAALVARLKEQR